MNQEWEYCVEKLGSIWRGTSPEELELLLNQAAADGWEPVTVFNPSGGNRLMAILRRKLRPTSRRRRSD